MNVGVEKVKSWMTRSSLFGSRRLEAADFMRRMRREGYGIMDRALLNQELCALADRHQKIGYDLGVSLAVNLFTNPNTTRTHTAAFLLDNGQYAALDRFRRQKKLGWAALGFSRTQTAMIEKELAKLEQS